MLLTPRSSASFWHFCFLRLETSIFTRHHQHQKEVQDRLHLHLHLQHQILHNETFGSSLALFRRHSLDSIRYAVSAPVHPSLNSSKCTSRNCCLDASISNLEIQSSVQFILKSRYNKKENNQQCVNIFSSASICCRNKHEKKIESETCTFQDNLVKSQF